MDWQKLRMGNVSSAVLESVSANVSRGIYSREPFERPTRGGEFEDSLLVGNGSAHGIARHLLDTTGRVVVTAADRCLYVSCFEFIPNLEQRESELESSAHSNCLPFRSGKQFLMLFSCLIAVSKGGLRSVANILSSSRAPERPLTRPSRTSTPLKYVGT